MVLFQQYHIFVKQLIIKHQQSTISCSIVFQNVINSQRKPYKFNEKHPDTILKHTNTEHTRYD